MTPEMLASSASGRLLDQLLADGFELAADGDRLRIRPAERVTPELRAMLQARKPDLLPILLRLEAMRRHGVDLSPDRRHPERPPVAVSRWPGLGGPGSCFSCGDRLGLPEGYGRCTPCDIAADLFYSAREDESEAPTCA